MKSLPACLAFLVWGLMVIGAGCQSEEKPAAPAAPQRTEVVIFNPSPPPVIEDNGRCWTDSVAVNRPGVWRCMRENMIFDPCFAIAHEPQRVICGADPTKGERGFVLKLTEPLPAQLPLADRSARPWLIELADGSICSAATGTMAAIEGESVRYPCTGPKLDTGGKELVYTGLLGTMYPGKLWTADQVWFTVEPNEEGLPYKLTKRQTVAIRRVWE